MKRIFLGMLALGISSPLYAQNVTPETLVPQFENLMARTRIEAVAPYGDGFVVVGEFTGTDGVDSRNIIRWDGQKWVGFDITPDPGIRAVIEYEGDLWISGVYGNIRDADGKPVQGDYNRAIRWDGNQWIQSYQGITGVPEKYVIWRDRLVAIGFLGTTGNSTVYIAEWNGDEWVPFAQQPNFEPYDVVVYEDDLVLSGVFNQIGGESLARIARYDGTSWTGFPELNQVPEVLGVHGDYLYAGGNFIGVNGLSSRLIRFDGNQWNAVASLPHQPEHIRSDGEKLYVVYRSFASEPYRPDKVVAYNGTEVVWESEWLDQTVEDMNLVSGQMFFGGYFARVNGQWESGLAVAGPGGLEGFEGDEIFRRDPEILTAASNGGDLYIGGDFIRDGDIYLSHVAHWDGTEFRQMGDGFAEIVYHLDIMDGNVVGGTRFVGNDGSVHTIKIWDGGQWTVIPDMMNGTLEAMLVHDGQLYIGGQLNSGSNRNLGRWNGSSWDFSLGSPDGIVYGLTEHEGKVVATGVFETIGNTSVNHVGSLENGFWTDLGQGLNDFARWSYSVEDTLYITGNFSFPGQVGIYHSAKRNDSIWEPVRGDLDGLIYDMETAGDVLFVSGQLHYSGPYGGTLGKLLSRWGGEGWVPLENSMTGTVNQIVYHNGGLWVLGDVEYTVDGIDHREAALQYQVLQLPGDFTLTGPTNAAVVDSLTPTYYWTASENANRYLMQVYDNPEYNHPPLASEFVDRTKHKPLISLEPGQSYFWRVRANSDAGESQWRYGSFSTSATAVGIDDDAALLPDAVALHPAYPNPFNPTTTLKFDLPQAAMVNITAFDVLGRPVATLLNGQRMAGSHHIAVDASRWASGMYFVQMRAGSEVVTQKMMLVK